MAGGGCGASDEASLKRLRRGCSCDGGASLVAAHACAGGGDGGPSVNRNRDGAAAAAAGSMIGVAGDGAEVPLLVGIIGTAGRDPYSILCAAVVMVCRRAGAAAAGGSAGEQPDRRSIISSRRGVASAAVRGCEPTGAGPHGSASRLEYASGDGHCSREWHCGGCCRIAERHLTAEPTDQRRQQPRWGRHTHHPRESSST